MNFVSTNSFETFYYILFQCAQKILSFSTPHITTIVRFDYISNTFGHFKFVNGFCINWWSIFFIVVTFIMLFAYKYNLDPIF
jgi:hypothetical protein